MLVGISGKACAGKNLAAELLKKKGFAIIDVDSLGHKALNEKLDRIEEVFGSAFIKKKEDKGFIVDRKALGRLVFSKPAEMTKLEEIVHPWVKKETLRLCEKYYKDGYSNIAINAAILHKMNIESKLDAIIWIEACLYKRIKRAIKRDKIGLITMIKRISIQRKLSPKTLYNFVDMYSVENNAGLEPLKQRLEAVLNDIDQRKINGR